MAEFTDTFQQRHAFAAFLQETWRAGKEVLPCDGGCVLIGVGPDVQTGRGSKGVAIVLSSSAAAAWRAAGAVVHDGFGSRVLAVPLAVKDPLSGSRLDVLLVSAYAPVSTADSEVWDAYYDALSRAIVAAPAGATIVVGTDANASVGRGSLGGPADDHADAVGPFGIEHINGSGRRLRTFLETHELASLASFFKKRFYGTWQHPASKQMHQLDHILITRCDLKRFTDAGSVSGQLISSDHRALGCRLRIQVQLQRKPPATPSEAATRLDHATLKGSREREAFARGVVAAVAVAVAAAPSPPQPPLPPTSTPTPTPTPTPLPTPSAWLSPPVPSARRRRRRRARAPPPSWLVHLELSCFIRPYSSTSFMTSIFNHGVTYGYG